MGKRLTTKEFIEKAKKVHGDKYDYSKVRYVNSVTKVCIVCPIHGDFWQTPNIHLFNHGCQKCSAESSSKRMSSNGLLRRHKSHGVGINDYQGSVYDENGKLIAAFKTWYGMLQRCYDKSYKEKMPTYKDCVVCEAWKSASAFKEWHDEHYVEGWHLDKDILVKGNKEYGPSTCCFVPNEINILFVKANALRKDLPIGVRKRGNCIYAELFKYNKRVYLGTFATTEQAFQAYKVAKEAYIKEVADKWKDQLEPRVYEAMYNYKVEITD